MLDARLAATPRSESNSFDNVPCHRTKARGVYETPVFVDRPKIIGLMRLILFFGKTLALCRGNYSKTLFASVMGVQLVLAFCVGPTLGRGKMASGGANGSVLEPVRKVLIRIVFPRIG